MKTLYKYAALLLAATVHAVYAVEVGDEVCITGFIMDNCKCVFYYVHIIYVHILWA